MDGEITIGTKLDTDKFDRQITQLEKKMQKEEDKKIIIEAKLGSQQGDLEKARQETDKLADAYQRLNELQDRLATGKATPGEFTAFQDLQNTYGSLEQLGASFDKALSKQDAIEQKVAQTEYRYDEINAKVSEYKQKIEGIKLQQQVAEVDRMKDSFNSVGSSIQSAITKVSKLALGIFGVRSAYLALRRASSDLASYDKQYAANIEYIRYALTQAIAPVLQWIVRLAATLLGYINAIMQGWFGINLFSRGSAENFNKMKKSSSGVSKAVKEIKKQLSGFDEVNMLTSQSDTGTKAGAGGVGTPDFDLSKMQGKIPDWLQWLIDNGEFVKDIIEAITFALITMKLTGLDPILSLGIGIIIKGVLDIIKSIVDYIKNPTWENFLNILKGVSEVLIGIGVILGTLTGNWIPLLIGLVAYVGVQVAKNWESIKATLLTVGKWMYDKVITPVLKFFKEMWAKIKETFKPTVDFFKEKFKGAFEKIKEAFKGVGKFFESVWNTIRGVFVGIGQKMGNAVGESFKKAVNAIFDILEGIVNAPIRAINGLIGVINAVPGINLGYLNTLSLPRLKTGAIINMPNRGTLVGGGSAIAGEAGHEGILPLDDRQAMAELGAEIGKHVVINLTNINKMNARVIGRELKQVQSEQDFAFNN